MISIWVYVTRSLIVMAIDALGVWCFYLVFALARWQCPATQLVVANHFESSPFDWEQLENCSCWEKITSTTVETVFFWLSFVLLLEARKIVKLDLQLSENEHKFRRPQKTAWTSRTVDKNSTKQFEWILWVLRMEIVNFCAIGFKKGSNKFTFSEVNFSQSIKFHLCHYFQFEIISVSFN